MINRLSLASLTQVTLCLLYCLLVESPFQAKFSGLVSVVRQVSDLSYLIKTPGCRKATKLCHVNLLKPYHTRESLFPLPQKVPAKPILVSSLVLSSSMSEPVVVGGKGVDIASNVGVLQGQLRNSETLKRLDILVGHLDGAKRDELTILINSYLSLFSDAPTQTHLIKHDIDVGVAEPIKQRFYRMSDDKRRQLEAEVEYMLDNGIAEPCSSNWASPHLLVKKADASLRPCTDYRKVNSLTKLDLYPLPCMEDCIDLVGSATFVSKFDLLKGYWQVPITKRAREISAFITPSGLYSYTVMPFGLRNAPATFQQLMNRVVSGLSRCAMYLDDVVVFLTPGRNVASM